MEQWVGRDSNPEPTPKASGLLSLSEFLDRVQCTNGKLRILFAFELKFN